MSGPETAFVFRRLKLSVCLQTYGTVAETSLLVAFHDYGKTHDRSVGGGKLESEEARTSRRAHGKKFLLF
jgi:hypothetical protein